MTKLPAFQFYPGDWQRDAALRACSVAARGCWIEMICIMHQAKPYGHLRVNGAPVSDSTLARMIGATLKDVSRWLGEMEAAGVFDRESDGCIVSRRMVKDDRVRKARAAGGKLGGNPNLTPDVKVNLDANLTPNLDANQHHACARAIAHSSSSSSSSSLKKQTAEIIPKEFESDEFRNAWSLWKKHRGEAWEPLTEATGDVQLMDLMSHPVDEAVAMLMYSIKVGAKTPITNGDHKNPPKQFTGSTNRGSKLKLI